MEKFAITKNIRAARDANRPAVARLGGVSSDARRVEEEIE